MNNKRNILTIVLILSLALNVNFVLNGSTGLLTRLGLSVSDYETGTADASSHSSEIFSKLSSIDYIVNNYYLYADEIDQEAMLDSLYAGYIDGLDETYTTYYTAEEYEALQESNSGEYSGIGVSVQQDSDTLTITVIQSFENGPAYAAGIRKDDIITAVDGTDITGEDINNVVTMIKGEEGTTVLITVYRPSEGEYLDFEVERQVVQNPTISYEMLDDTIGYIQITEFDEVTVEQFEEAIDDLLSQGMEGVIFDLRDNPGGLLTSVCDMLDLLLPEGDLLVYTMDKNGTTTEYYAESEDSLSIPMIVLVNENSASASEIFTAALQDYGVAKIMGTTTYGKGIVQVIVSLTDGSAVKVTQSEYYTPNGVCIHGVGVEPDITVEYDSDAEEDNQIAAALLQMQSMLEE